MKTKNSTYTYRHSELPEISPEIKSEIVALDVWAANIIQKSVGNYRALEELMETLSDLLDSCELNLNSIRIIPDGSNECDATNLPIEQKQAVYSMNYTNSIMLSVLAEHTGKTREAVASFLADTFQANQLTVTEDELNQFMRQFVEASRMTPVKKFVFVNSSKDKSDEK